MARRFRGESENKVDAKGRVSVPAAFRRVLEEGDPDWTTGLNPNLVLVYGGKSRNFIEGYTMTEMENVDDRIAGMKRGSRDRRLLEHMFSSQSVQVQVDETGRLVLTQKLRDKLGITKQAMFVATVDTFQIWEPSAYEAHAERFESWVEDEDEDFDPLILLDSPQPVE
ncbi:MAG: division/cell wall cluster transcriptional repressor MraZ [Rhodobacteraceae bacterium]|nr:division/cell wall cluster transcriptional repressor MraZ [Paracoccaceae bacterium]